MHELPTLTNELAERIERAIADYALRRWDGIDTQPGKPNGLEVARFGRAIALKVPAMPFIDSTNGVYCFSGEELAHSS